MITLILFNSVTRMLAYFVIRKRENLNDIFFFVDFGTSLVRIVEQAVFVVS